MNRIEEIRDRLDKATSGPWHWSNISPTRVFLIGPAMRTVMAFKRSGMQSAQPAFRGADGLLQGAANANINDFPDADLIARAPDDLQFLLAYIHGLEGMVSNAWQQGYDARQADMGAADKTPNPYRTIGGDGNE
mgnify:CR=1 FL=1